MTDSSASPETTTEPIGGTPPHPWHWAREHLFSSPPSTVLTLCSLAIVTAFARGMIGFIVAGTRRWESVAANLRLMMTRAYPPDRYLRVWVAVGLVVALTGLSMGVWRAAGRIGLRRLIAFSIGTGAAAAGIGMVSTGIVPLWWSVGLAVGGAAMAAGGWVVRHRAQDRLDDSGIPVLGVVSAIVVLLLIGLWTVPFGQHGFAASELLPARPGTVALTTRLPWTILAGVLLGSYLLGRWLRDRINLRPALIGGWVLSMPVITLVVLRAPDLTGWQGTRDIGTYTIAAIGGSLLLTAVVTRPGAAAARVAIVAGAIVVVFWPGALPMIVRLPSALFGVFTVTAPSFEGQSRRRARYCGLWVITLTLLAFLVAMGGVPSSIGFQSTSYLGGLTLTLVLAVTGILISFPLGLVLALARTSSMPVFRMLAVAFIELARGIPFLVVLLVADRLLRVLLPQILTLDDVVIAIVATGLYFSAYMAENLRGGLQAIPIGQYEAARSLGLGPLQTTAFIVLPQAVRAVVPTLVGQAITIFKETSLIAIIGLWDLLYIGAKVVPQQSAFLGALRENLLFVAAVYWVFTFSFSRASLRIERKMGLGEGSHYGAL